MNLDKEELTEKESEGFAESAEDCAVFLKKGELSPTAPVPAEQVQAVRGASTRKFIKRHALLVPAVGAAGLLAGVCWLLTGTTAFDADIGHADHASPWWILLWVLLGIGTAAALLMAWSGRRVRQYRPQPLGMAETFLALLGAGLYGIRSLQLIYTCFLPGAEVSGLAKAAALTQIFCALYLLLVGLGKKGPGVTVCAMGSIAGVMLVLFRDYFDFTLPLNSPVRNLVMLSGAAILLFFTSEARAALDLWYVGMPFALFANSAAVVFAGGLGLAGAVMVFLGTSAMSGHSLLDQAASLVVAALALCRLCRYPSLVGDHMPPPPTEEEIKKYEKKRAAK